MYRIESLYHFERLKVVAMQIQHSEVFEHGQLLEQAQFEFSQEHV